MKYIKKYEKLIAKYKAGDYVLLEDVIEPHIEIYLDSPFAKILELGDTRIYKAYNRYYVKCYDPKTELKSSELFYNVEVFVEKLNDFESFWIGERIIIRKLTPEEIEDYEIKKLTKKYNL